MASLLVAFALSALGQPNAADASEKSESREAKANAEEEVAKYECFLQGNSLVKLTREPQAVLRWTNHLNRRFYGDIYVWTNHGRPEAVASITNVYSDTRHAMETEVHSLSLQPLKAERSGQVIWEPSQAGVQLRPIPGASLPADSPAARLRQLREYASRFTVSSQTREDRWQLRLLPRPVHRYASTDPLILDGALFAFTKGTDPDVFLVIEARRVGEVYQWQFAFARFTGSADLQASFDQSEVWKVSALASRSRRDPRGVYTSFARRSD